MFEGWNVGVVVPARDEEEYLPEVLSTMPSIVDLVVVVDDGSTDGTADVVKDADLVTLDGEGVGAAIDAGHQHLLAKMERPFISVVMAGDGQMDPADLPALLKPIVESKAHHVKGERINRAGKMPLLRRFGTALLSFFTTLACGQSIRDPQCGYTATAHEVLVQWDWETSWKGYGYPNWWLMHLTMEGWHIAHVPVKAVYGDQNSGISIPSFFLKVSAMLFVGLHKRQFDWLPGVISSHPIPLILASAYILGWLGIVYAISGKTIALLFTIILWWSAHRLDRMFVDVMRRPLE
jgi:glycosyltransferase involved in cell wall biosynthesis